MTTRSVFDRPSDRGRRTLATTGVVLMCGLAGVLPADASARSQKVTEDVRLTLVKKTGLSFDHRGTARGTYDGSVRSKLKMDALSITGVVRITTRGGSVNLRIRGSAKSGGLRSKFDGTAEMAGGTGRFRKARGKGRFSGVVNRQTWAVSLRASGTLIL